MKAVEILAALSLLMLVLAGCGNSVATDRDEGYLPRTATERDAADVVRSYDLAIRRNDAVGVCRIVGGEERDVFRCRTQPSVLGFLSGSASGADGAYFFKVSSARGALRVTRVAIGLRA